MVSIVAFQAVDPSSILGHRTSFAFFHNIVFSGIRTLSEKTKIGAHGKPVMFLHPKDCGGVLMELEQK